MSDVTILVGDVFDQLAQIKTESIDCVVSSPPYWGLRSYIADGDPLKPLEIGLEPTLGQHLEVLVRVFREVRRVLKAHGTCWLNYGDCYATSPNGRAAADVQNDDRTFRDKPFSTIGQIHAGRAGGGQLKNKDLCMIPNRLAIALQDDGWYVRSEIIWHKPNPMPESVYDRPTSAHEKIWLLTKSEDYFYNAEAIREAVSPNTHARVAQNVAAQAGSTRANGGTRPDRPMKAVVRATGPNSRINVDRVPVSRKAQADHGARRAKNNASFDAALADNDSTARSRKMRGANEALIKSNARFAAGTQQHVDSRNSRNVWTIAPKAFREAHFATFPPDLAKRCILAGVPPTVCGACGAVDNCGGLCSHWERQPGHVLDPFGGAGTVGLVARQLGLRSTLIELNPEYAEIARRRIFGNAQEAAE